MLYDLTAGKQYFGVVATLLAKYAFGSRKEVGENTTIGMIDELKSGLSVIFADCLDGQITIDDFVTGKKIEKEYYPEASLCISASVELYLIVGVSVNIGFDIGHFLNHYYPLY